MHFKKCNTEISRLNRQQGSSVDSGAIFDTGNNGFTNIPLN